MEIHDEAAANLADHASRLLEEGLVDSVQVRTRDGEKLGEKVTTPDDASRIKETINKAHQNLAPYIDSTAESSAKR